MTDMLYQDLFKQLESVRWDMSSDIEWNEYRKILNAELAASTA